MRWVDESKPVYITPRPELNGGHRNLIWTTMLRRKSGLFVTTYKRRERARRQPIVIPIGRAAQPIPLAQREFWPYAIAFTIWGALIGQLLWHAWIGGQG